MGPTGDSTKEKHGKGLLRNGSRRGEYDLIRRYFSHNASPIDSSVDNDQRKTCKDNDLYMENV
jgi:hypothetical protein